MENSWEYSWCEWHHVEVGEMGPNHKYVEWSCLQHPLAVRCSNHASWTMNWSRTDQSTMGPGPHHVHLMSTWRDECSQAFPVLHCSSTSMYYCQRKLKNEKRGRPWNEARLLPSPLLSLFWGGMLFTCMMSSCTVVKPDQPLTFHDTTGWYSQLSYFQIWNFTIWIQWHGLHFNVGTHNARSWKLLHCL